MVEIEEVDNVVMLSDERLLDAEEIERVAEKCTRPGAKLQLESLAKKMRKEAQYICVEKISMW